MHLEAERFFFNALHSYYCKNPSKLTYTTLPTFTTTQVGYTLVGTSNSTANLTPTMVTYATLTLNAGVYIITGILATGYSGSVSGVGVYVYQATTQLPGGFHTV